MFLAKIRVVASTGVEARTPRYPPPRARETARDTARDTAPARYRATSRRHIWANPLISLGLWIDATSGRAVMGHVEGHA